MMVTRMLRLMSNLWQRPRPRLQSRPKPVLTVLLLLAVLVAAGLRADEFPYPAWVRVMSDRGDAGSRWFMVSSPRRSAVKKLTLDFPASEVAEAALEYQIQMAPYDPGLKQHIRTANYPWSNLLVRVNGQLILDEPAARHISVGVHHLRFPAEHLQEGENTIAMTWKELPEGNPEKLRLGYIYFARDLPQTPAENDEPNLRIRLLLRFRDGAE